MTFLGCAQSHKPVIFVVFCSHYLLNKLIFMSQKVNFALFIEIVFMSSGIFQVVIRQEIIR